jgi:hypothetical protein
MIFNPCQIENINEATAQAAALVPIGLGHRRSTALRAHVFAARKRLVDIHDRNHGSPQKKSGPECSGPDSLTARGVHPTVLPSWIISSRRSALSN